MLMPMATNALVVRNDAQIAHLTAAPWRCNGAKSPGSVDCDSQLERFDREEG